MPRTALNEISRRELVEAAFEVLQQAGITGTTILRVAQQAGVSKGIVLHYFRDKDELIEHTMRYANDRLRRDVVDLLQQSDSPMDRIGAVIKGNFLPRSFRPEIAHAWLSFCAEVPFNRQYARLQRVIHARMRSNLLTDLQKLLPPAEAEDLAFGITTMIDGLWLRCGLQNGGIDRETALKEMQRYMEKMLPGFEWRDMG